MGYIKHNAIIVTDYLVNDELNLAHAKAKELLMSVSNIIGPVVNGTKSFLVGPDGSKEGWDSSAEGDKKREEFKAFLKDYCPTLHWIEVRYGGDDIEIAFIIDHAGKELT